VKYDLVLGPRKLTEERDSLAAELKHSEEQFAALVGEIFDQKLASIQSMVSAAVSPPASPNRKVHILVSLEAVCCLELYFDVFYQHK
jgi:hypothetical protein